MGIYLELGAGKNPSPAATHTLDIREDLDHIDFPGVDIGVDRWPLEDESVDLIIANHVFEHIERANISHMFREVDRVLKEGGRLEATVPHAGAWEAHTDPTHQGPGGWTPDIDEYFSAGSLEGYWTDLEWTVSATAQVAFPVFVRPSLRLRTTVSRGAISNELVKIPFVSGIVTFVAEKGPTAHSR